MTYNDSMVAALALSQILNGVETLSGVDKIVESEICKGLLHSLEYYVGSIAKELTHPSQGGIGCGMIDFTKNVLFNLDESVDANIGIRKAALECVHKLQRVALDKKYDYQHDGYKELQREIESYRKSNIELLDFVNKKNQLKEYSEHLQKNK